MSNYMHNELQSHKGANVEENMITKVHNNETNMKSVLGMSKNG